MSEILGRARRLEDNGDYKDYREIMGDYMRLLAEFCLKLIPPTVGVYGFRILRILRLALSIISDFIEER